MASWCWWWWASPPILNPIYQQSLFVSRMDHSVAQRQLMMMLMVGRIAYYRIGQQYYDNMHSPLVRLAVSFWLFFTHEGWSKHRPRKIGATFPFGRCCWETDWEQTSKKLWEFDCWLIQCLEWIWWTSRHNWERIKNYLWKINLPGGGGAKKKVTWY